MTAKHYKNMVRDAEEKDIPQITRICNYYIVHSTANFEEHPTNEAEMLSEMQTIKSAGCPYLVWDAEGQVLGYCYAHPWKQKSAYCRTWETTIYMAPEAVGKGFGTQLCQALINACKERGAHVLIADITDENEVSVKMHEKLGFQAVSHFREVGMKFGRWLGDIDMQLVLT